MDKVSLVIGWLIMILPLMVLAAVYESQLPLLNRIVLVIILGAASSVGIEIMRREINKL